MKYLLNISTEHAMRNLYHQDRWGFDPLNNLGIFCWATCLGWYLINMANASLCWGRKQPGAEWSGIAVELSISKMSRRFTEWLYDIDDSNQSWKHGEISIKFCQFLFCCKFKERWILMEHRTSEQQSSFKNQRVSETRWNSRCKVVCIRRIHWAGLLLQPKKWIQQDQVTSCIRNWDISRSIVKLILDKHFIKRMHALVITLGKLSNAATTDFVQRQNSKEAFPGGNLIGKCFHKSKVFWSVLGSSFSR